MAGPSSAKAGLAKDQDEINKIIYEVSKGSKFFDNERKKDAQTTERINALLARRDQKLLQVPPGSSEWLSIERKIQDMATRLENSRDLDPSLKGKCFGVGSGVLVTASYEARRGYGVRSGMAVFVAKALCPHLIVVKNDMQSYVQASQKVMAVFEQYDENLAKASLDEAYLDVTDYVEQHGGSIDQVVQQLRDQVRSETQLTVSVGIAPNTMLAKISSDRNKPDGQFRVQPDRKAIVDFMRHLPCRKIPGIGRVNERILESLGVTTCGEIWNKRVELWLALDGKIEWLIKAHLGIGNTVVEPASEKNAKASVANIPSAPPQIPKLCSICSKSRPSVSSKIWNASTSKAKPSPLLPSATTFNASPEPKHLPGWCIVPRSYLRGAAAGEERLRKLFQARPSTSEAGHGEHASSTRKTAQEWQQEEERQLALAIKQSLEGTADPFNQVQDLSQDDDPSARSREQTPTLPAFNSEVDTFDAAATSEPHIATQPDEPSDGPAVQCPICSKPIHGSNDQLNAHIDTCLNQSQLGPPPPRRNRNEIASSEE
ncbi:related to DNA polymerase kappa [Ustilago trichophora]|uniref:DNA polymerase kappa n=1 Tax=Ustilago trichophora TaxID=86804 RepID=A0A5C3E6W6_9BASI|nr:related to DNA polymerase kappa [Ustilago trichophora]